MGMFPTSAALRLAKDAELEQHTQTIMHLNDAISDFQKVCATASFEDAMTMFDAHLYLPISEDQRAVLKKIYDFTQVEINGIVIDSIGRVMSDSKLEANKLAAAKLIHDIRNGDGAGSSSNDVKKIIFELAKD